MVDLLLTQDDAEIQANHDAVAASKMGVDSSTDLADTQATAALKSGVHAMGASSSNAPSTDRSVVLTMARDADASGELRHGQVLLNEAGDLYFAIDDGGTLGAWKKAMVTGESISISKTTASSVSIVRTGGNAAEVILSTGGNAGSLTLQSLTNGPQIISAQNSDLVHTADGVEKYRFDGSANSHDYVGDLSVTGALSKGSGSFKIDHPLPSKTDTHHLVHSFIEGPKADLNYRGVVDLVAGSATIDLDAVSGMTSGTFVALCQDVQCFTTNESGWTSVRGSVSGNTLTITSETSCVDSVSWLVIGERKDPHMVGASWTDDSGHVIVEPGKE